MNVDAFLGITGCLPEPFLLVRVDGQIVAANDAAIPVFCFDSARPTGVSILSLVRDSPERIRTYLRACSRTHSLLPGSLSLERDGTVRRYRCEAAAFRTAPATPTDLVLLRLRPADAPVDRFTLLTRKVDELSREVRVRQRVEAERTALLASETASRARAELMAAQLEQNTAELEAALDEAGNARRLAEQANRTKSEFLAMMSHELRTPLNAIVGHLQLLRLGLHGPITEAQESTLARMDKSQRHLLRLINDILNFARIEVGELQYAMADVSIGAVLQGLAPMIDPQLAASKLKFDVQIPASIPSVRADISKLEQIVLNLITNALKFTPPGGELIVDATPNPENEAQVLIQFIDTGIGIPPDRLDAVFEPFVQVDAGLTRRSEGVGLGLAISRELARGMGGDLTAQSAEGVGSTFTLSLPVADGRELGVDAVPK